ncbi:MAG TPA: putative baseplate assembly protein, partial [Isosphaeraceae bacterium]|nr:putative baseplate assembly protein [Isosphaeraceae bacterium]
TGPGGGAITSWSVVTPDNPPGGYRAGDTGTITGGGGTGAMYKILSVNRGYVGNVTINPAGSGYSVTQGAQTATGGTQAGTGDGSLTINILTTSVTTTTSVSYQTQSISSAWPSLLSPGNPLPSAVALDAVYDQIKTGSWVAIDRPSLDASGNVSGQRTVTYHQVQALQTQSMDTTTGFTAKVTLLTLNPTWLSDDPNNLSTKLGSTAVLRGTVVYAQAEPLDLAEEPLDRDVEKDTIELAELYDGLETGRWIIVSGERTDIPNTTGVTASELVMIAGVTQGSQAPLCATFPATDSTGAPYIPFAQVYYTTEANTVGDCLLVGELNGDQQGLSQLFSLIQLPNVPNQQFCDQVQLSPGVYVNAYVPTAPERMGSFSDFEGLLVDPVTLSPYPDGAIPSSVFPQVFAWRISTQPVHTILTLANDLSYTYDSTTVTIYGNVAKATHGQTVGEVLGDGDGSQSLRRFTLGQSPLTYLPAPTPAGAASTLVVRVNEVEWQEADNLAGLGPRDHDYITQTDDAQDTTVIFGTGVYGSRLPTGSSNVKATYRYGIGTPGNVDAQQISQLASQPLGLNAVINPLPASGGADADTLDQARRNAPLAVEALDRLVSVEDYAEFALTYAGIGKASSARLTDGRRLVVHLTIAGAEDIPIDPSSDLYLNFVQSLYQNGDPYQAIQVALRKLKVLVISAGVNVLPDYQWESVEPNVRAALLGTFGFDQRDLGQSTFLGEVISTMQAVEGVSYVNVTTFDSVAEDVTAAQLAALASTLALNPVVEADLAEVDPTQTDPTKRIVPAELAIVTPDIPDTVILTQITT